MIATRRNRGVAGTAGGPDEPSLADIHEVRRLGGRDSAFRSADQTAAALFWHCAPLSLWTEAAGMVLALEGNPELLARGLMLVSHALSQVPGVIAAQSALRPTPRPAALIRGTAPSRLADISIDPTWEPLVHSSNESGYPSVTCLRAGTTVGLLRVLLGHDGAVFSLSHELLGVTRTIPGLTAMLQEVEDARIWGGTHLRSIAIESTELGLALANDLYGKSDSPSSSRTRPDSRA